MRQKQILNLILIIISLTLIKECQFMNFNKQIRQKRQSIQSNQNFLNSISLTNQNTGLNSALEILSNQNLQLNPNNIINSLNSLTNQNPDLNPNNIINSLTSLTNQNPQLNPNNIINSLTGLANQNPQLNPNNIINSLTGLANQNNIDINSLLNINSQLTNILNQSNLQNQLTGLSTLVNLQTLFNNLNMNQLNLNSLTNLIPSNLTINQSLQSIFGSQNITNSITSVLSMLQFNNFTECLTQQLMNTQVVNQCIYNYPLITNNVQNINQLLPLMNTYLNQNISTLVNSIIYLSGLNENYCIQNMSDCLRNFTFLLLLKDSIFNSSELNILLNLDLRTFLVQLIKESNLTSYLNNPLVGNLSNCIYLQAQNMSQIHSCILKNELLFGLLNNSDLNNLTNFINMYLNQDLKSVLNTLINMSNLSNIFTNFEMFNLMNLQNLFGQWIMMGNMTMNQLIIDFENVKNCLMNQIKNMSTLNSCVITNPILKQVMTKEMLSKLSSSVLDVYKVLNSTAGVNRTQLDSLYQFAMGLGQMASLIDSTTRATSTINPRPIISLSFKTEKNSFIITFFIGLTSYLYKYYY